MSDFRKALAGHFNDNEIDLIQRLLRRQGPQPEQAEQADAHQFLTVKEAAARLRLSTMTIYRRCQDGEIDCVRIGQTYRVRMSAVAALEGGRS